MRRFSSGKENKRNSVAKAQSSKWLLPKTFCPFGGILLSFTYLTSFAKFLRLILYVSAKFFGRRCSRWNFRRRNPQERVLFLCKCSWLKRRKKKEKYGWPYCCSKREVYQRKEKYKRLFSTFHESLIKTNKKSLKKRKALFHISMIMVAIYERFVISMIFLLTFGWRKLD